MQPDRYGNLKFKYQVAGIACSPEKMDELSEIGLYAAYYYVWQAGSYLARKVMEAKAVILPKNVLNI